MTIMFDDDNNPTFPPELHETQPGRAVISQCLHVRLAVAAELTRCGIYTNIDAALDDADTVVGFLNRKGYLTFGDTS